MIKKVRLELMNLSLYSGSFNRIDSFYKMK
jgi:hypothetical protein